VSGSAPGQESAASAAPADGGTDNDVGLDVTVRESVGRTALRLAGLAGEQIAAACGGGLAVAYKDPQPGEPGNSNPVSCVDLRVEALLRAALAAEFPEHIVIGEELPLHSPASGFAWIIDPIDGTNNFINGVPLFAASIGVLFEGRPVAGAIWCATSHELRPGIYHGIAGGVLHFDGSPLVRRTNRPWRGLVAEPGMAPSYGALGHTRVFGCAALEMAFVAAGLLRVAYISRPALWDITAGLALLRAANCGARVWRMGGWQPFSWFESWRDPAVLAKWCEPLLIGDSAALEAAAAGAAR
jgi:myo-inositol-1(or 4)-monophosphatase